MAQENDKETKQWENRFRDLAGRSYTQGIYTFTGFLGLAQQDIFWQQEREVSYAGYSLYGGYPDAERVVVRFGEERELGYAVPFPIVCLHLKPPQQKFAEELSHRDFLGALMNLGIDRGTLGDIRVGEKEAWLFCLDTVSEFLCQNFRKVKHTPISCSVAEADFMPAPERPEQLTVQVSSLRVDALIAKVYNLSREKSLELFRAGKVYVDGRPCLNNDRFLKTGETVNARGFGKFRLTEGIRETKKGRLAIEVAVYR